VFGSSCVEALGPVVNEPVKCLGGNALFFIVVCIGRRVCVA
jgi:hypothetical protein